MPFSKMRKTVWEEGMRLVVWEEFCLVMFILICLIDIHLHWAMNIVQPHSLSVSPQPVLERCFLVHIKVR